MASRLARKVSGDSLLDPRVMATLREWSACMQSHGHEVVLPDDPVNEIRMSPGVVSEPTAEEVQMAVTDVACKTQTNLIDTWVAVEIEMQNAAMADDYTKFMLNDERSRIDAMLARAAELTESSP